MSVYFSVVLCCNQAQQEAQQQGLQFRQTEGQPDSVGSQAEGQADERRDQEEKAPCQGQQGGRLDALHALVVPDDGEVEDEEEEGRGKERETRCGQLGGMAAQVYEYSHQYLGKEHEHGGDYCAAAYGCQ